jgi:hypothetical protein
MEFTNPGDVAFRMVNLSDVTLSDPKYYFLLIDLDGPRTFNLHGTMLPQLLPIPAFADAGDFLKGKSKFMGRPIVSTFPAVQSIVKPNDRVFGLATVSCPSCLKDRQYWLYFVVGSGGWYCEIPWEDKRTWPLARMVSDTENVLKELAPENKRVLIVQDN